jgi:hypothetical protein
VAMTSNGAVTLGDIIDTITMLEVACDQCERRSRLRVAQHGARWGFPNFVIYSPAIARVPARCRSTISAASIIRSFLSDLTGGRSSADRADTQPGAELRKGPLTPGAIILGTAVR